jgi:hypothetical protein
VKRIGRLTGLWVAILLSSAVWGQGIQINASSSRTTVGLNEPFRIHWSWSARNTKLTPPNLQDFIIVSGPYQSSQTQIINGSASFTRKVSYEVVATKEGRFTIPPATLMEGGKLYKSNPLNIEVKQGVKRKNSLSQKAKESFDVQILTSKKEVYVGEPIVLLMQAYLYEPVRDLNMLQAPNFENVLQKELDFEQSQRGEMVGGKLATILDFSKRLILPNKPGTLGGQELKISGKVQVPTGRRDFFGMPLTKFVQEVATAKIPAVKIKPLPTPKPADFSGAVGKLNFVREVSRSTISGDESITIKVRVEGNGNFNTISVPDLLQPQGFDVYDPKYNESIRYSERGVRGFKEYEYLLVPQFKGEFILPEMRFTYFDTKSQDYKTVIAPADTLKVESNDLAATPAKGSGNEGVEKREVKTIDEDIRYLQQGDFEPYSEIQLKKWSWIVLLLVALGWGIQALPRKEKAVVPTSKRKDLKRGVDQAFSAKQTDRYGRMLNALEELLLEQGIGREENHESALEKIKGEEVAAEFSYVKERCLMAQYAPVSAADDAELVTRFDALWDKM